MCAPPNSPALTPCTTSPETLHVPAVCRDLDVHLIDLAKDIFDVYYPLFLYDSHLTQAYYLGRGFLVVYR